MKGMIIKLKQHEQENLKEKQIEEKSNNKKVNKKIIMYIAFFLIIKKRSFILTSFIFDKFYISYSNITPEIIIYF